MKVFDLIEKVGLPIAGGLIMGYFIFLIMKQLMGNLVSDVGLGYFVYFVWQTITNTIDPAVSEMKKTIIRLTDQLRLLDQDMIRLQQKVNTVLELKEQEVHKNGKKETNKKTT